MLYFPGLQSIIVKDSSMPGSAKLAHLMQLCECDVFDYRSFNPTQLIDTVQKYDILFGSSLGGFFAFNLAVITGQTCVVANPSLYINKRCESLLTKYPEELNFITPEVLSTIKAEPVKTTYSNIHVLVNLDDEILDSSRVIAIAEEYGCNLYLFDKGGHECSNFTGEMLPLIKQIIKDK